MTEPMLCPFCGGEVIPPDWEDGDTLYYIEHRKGCFLLREGVKVISTYEIEDWNTRAEGDNDVEILRDVADGLFCDLMDADPLTAMVWAKAWPELFVKAVDDD